MKNAEQLVRFAARKAEKLFKQQGQIHAMYHYVRSDGSHGALVAPIVDDSPRAKDEIVAFAKAVFKTEDAVAYVFITEVWQLRQNELTQDEVERKYGSLQNAPGRTEAVMMMGEDVNGMVYGRMEIHRPPGREPYLGLLEVDRPDDMEGRMVGLLPLRGTKQ